MQPQDRKQKVNDMDYSTAREAILKLAQRLQLHRDRAPSLQFTQDEAANHYFNDLATISGVGRKSRAKWKNEHKRNFARTYPSIDIKVKE